MRHHDVPRWVAACRFLFFGRRPNAIRQFVNRFAEDLVFVDECLGVFLKFAIGIISQLQNCKFGLFCDEPRHPGHVYAFREVRPWSRLRICLTFRTLVRKSHARYKNQQETGNGCCSDYRSLHISRPPTSALVHPRGGKVKPEQRLSLCDSPCLLLTVPLSIRDCGASYLANGGGGPLLSRALKSPSTTRPSPCVPWIPLSPYKHSSPTCQTIGASRYARSPPVGSRLRRTRGVRAWGTNSGAPVCHCAR